MSRRGYLLLSLVAVPLVIVGYDRFTSILWVGSTDLEIEFLVVDAETGDPIPGARSPFIPPAGTSTPKRTNGVSASHSPYAPTRAARPGVSVTA